MLNLDTHILLHALAGSLRKAERSLLTGHAWSISAIVLWEIAKLKQLDRIEIDLRDPLIVDALSNVHVWPIDRDVALASTELDISGDPADELIAATSLVHHVPLLTRDRSISRSRLIPLAH